MSDTPKDGKKAMGKVESKKTEKGPHGGGHKYNQAVIGKGFLQHKPITGHTQEKNIDKK